MMQTLGHVGDLEGESVVIDDWQITITDVEGRSIQNLELTKINPQQQILIGSH